MMESALSPEELQEKYPWQPETWNSDKQILSEAWEARRREFQEYTEIPETMTLHGNLINVLPAFIKNGFRHPDFEGPHHEVKLIDYDIPDEVPKLTYKDSLNKVGLYVEIEDMERYDTPEEKYTKVREASRVLFDKVQKARNRQSLLKKLFG